MAQPPGRLGVNQRGYTSASAFLANASSLVNGISVTLTTAFLLLPITTISLRNDPGKDPWTLYGFVPLPSGPVHPITLMARPPTHCSSRTSLIPEVKFGACPSTVTEKKPGVPRPVQT